MQAPFRPLVGGLPHNTVIMRMPMSGGTIRPVCMYVCMYVTNYMCNVLGHNYHGTIDHRNSVQQVKTFYSLVFGFHLS